MELYNRYPANEDMCEGCVNARWRGYGHDEHRECVKDREQDCLEQYDKVLREAIENGFDGMVFTTVPECKECVHVRVVGVGMHVCVAGHKEKCPYER